MLTLDDLEHGYHIRDLSLFLGSSFTFSSAKDRLIKVVYESLKECLWSACFRELDVWSNENTLQLLDLLVTVFRPENKVFVMFF